MGKHPASKDAHDKEDMQRSLGAAISAWARIEGALCWLFSQACNPRRTWVGQEIFQSVISHEVRVDMTNAAVKTYFRSQKHVLDEWTIILTKLKSARKLRAKLAHAQIVQFGGKGPTKTYVMPFHYLESHKSPEAYEKHTLKQIDSYAKSFIELAAQIHKLHHEVKWNLEKSE
jgi:hypothetical protein